ncbi:protein of unknown function (plasmid) [Rhodovastum atsumiense]|nr:protein of unknown function [Rhodovastum atsumiense]
MATIAALECLAHHARPSHQNTGSLRHRPVAEARPGLPTAWEASGACASPAFGFASRLAVSRESLDGCPILDYIPFWTKRRMKCRTLRKLLRLSRMAGGSWTSAALSRPSGAG